MAHIETERSFWISESTGVELVTAKVLMRIEKLCEGTVICIHDRDSGLGTLVVREVSWYERDGVRIP